MEPPDEAFSDLKVGAQADGDRTRIKKILGLFFSGSFTPPAPQRSRCFFFPFHSFPALIHLPNRYWPFSFSIFNFLYDRPLKCENKT